MARFDFRQFSVDDGGCAMKVGTDSVLLGAWTDVANVSEALDLGAGSALLALMVAQKCPQSHITAIEIEADACQAAKKNVAASPWSKNIEVVCADACHYARTAIKEKRFDLIISNPPYFADNLKAPDSQRSTARHVGSLSATACVEIARSLLSKNGTLAMITPYDYDDSVTFAAEMARLKIWRKCEVSTVEGKKPIRILWQICRDQNRKLQRTALSVRQSDGSYHTDYIRLTKEFYLHL